MNNRAISWRSFSAAPHRLLFFHGALYGIVVIGLWTAQQASLHTTLLAPLAWSVPHPAAHGFMMVYGLMGFYLFGFLLTAFPRWMGGGDLPRRLYLPIWACHTFGAHAFWLGLFTSRWLVLLACLALLVSHGLVCGTLLAVGWRARRLGEGQAPYVVLGLGAGVAGAALAALGFGLWDTRLINLSRWVGLYPFLLLVVLSVTHRMVPFFTSTVTPGYRIRRSPWAPPLWLAALPPRAVAGFAGWHTAGWLLEALVLAVLLREAVGWRFWRVRGPHLLVVLYLGMGWIVAALALSVAGGAVQTAQELALPPFGQAALHALAVGGFGTLILGISTRVSLGHSGRGLATDPFLNTLFYGFQVVVLARVGPVVAGGWWPGLSVHGFWAGLGWALAFAAWLAWLGPTLLRPRADGRPG